MKDLVAILSVLSLLLGRISLALSLSLAVSNSLEVDDHCQKCWSRFCTFASLQKSVKKKKKQSSTKGFIDGKSFIKEYSNH